MIRLGRGERHRAVYLTIGRSGRRVLFQFGASVIALDDGYAFDSTIWLKTWWSWTFTFGGR